MKFSSISLLAAAFSVVCGAGTSPEIFSDGLVPTKYKVVAGFFELDEKATDAASFDITKASKFGLKDGAKWLDVVSYVNHKNRKHFHEGKAYKLFFLARHGEAFHNVRLEKYSPEDWACFWQERDGDDTMTWYDAELTSNGVKQATSMCNAWDRQLSLDSDPVPLPQSFYVSPMRRTSQTFTLTWSSLAHHTSDNFTPQVKEMARETYGLGTDSARHSKLYISQRWPLFAFDDDFTENDELWVADRHETHQHRKYRANLLLNDIFANDSNTIVSLTSHSGLIDSLLKVVHHIKFPLSTGQMIPVVVRASKPAKFTEPKLDKPWQTYDDQCLGYQPPSLVFRQPSVFRDQSNPMQGW